MATLTNENYRILFRGFKTLFVEEALLKELPNWDANKLDEVLKSLEQIAKIEKREEDNKVYYRHNFISPKIGIKEKKEIEDKLATLPDCIENYKYFISKYSECVILSEDESILYNLLQTRWVYFLS